MKDTLERWLDNALDFLHIIGELFGDLFSAIANLLDGLGDL